MIYAGDEIYDDDITSGATRPSDNWRNCQRCNLDRHQCRGCGIPTSHNIDVCETCGTEHP